MTNQSWYIDVTNQYRMLIQLIKGDYKVTFGFSTQ